MKERILIIRNTDPFWIMTITCLAEISFPNHGFQKK